MIRLSVATLFCGLLLSIPAVPQQTESKGTPPPAPQAPAANPQSKQPTQPGTLFTGGTKEIIVPVTVTDSKTGRYLSNLEQKDFRILLGCGSIP
jgi:hypothetical protein